MDTEIVTIGSKKIIEEIEGILEKETGTIDGNKEASDQTSINQGINREII